MDSMFAALLALLSTPSRPERGVAIDNSVLLVYPPERELDFREYLLDRFKPVLDARRIPHRLLDLSTFLFSRLTNDQVEALCDDEFDNYCWMCRGLSDHVAKSLTARLDEEAAMVPSGIVIVYATVALHPLVRYGNVLLHLRNIGARLVLAYPGEDRNGKLHFMNHADGANYLSIPLFAR